MLSGSSSAWSSRCFSADANQEMTLGSSEDSRDLRRDAVALPFMATCCKTHERLAARIMADSPNGGTCSSTSHSCPLTARLHPDVRAHRHHDHAAAGLGEMSVPARIRSPSRCC